MKTRTGQNKRLSKGLQMHYFKRVQTTIFLFCFLLISSLLYSQNKVYVDSTYFEDFSSSVSLWNQFSHSEGKAVINNDQYELVSNTSVFNTDINLVRDHSKDFTFEVSFDQLTTRDEDKSYGIYTERAGNYCLFTLNSKGLYSIRIITPTENKFLKEDAFAAGYRKFFGNKFKIEKKADKYFFYLNDIIVYETKDTEIKANGHIFGIILLGNHSIKVNALRVHGLLQQINLINDPIKGYQKINLGSSINSKHSELNPVISPDGKTLYFVRNINPNDNGDKSQHVWYSERIGENSWSEAKYVDFPLNIDHENTCLISVSADNNTLFVTGVFNPDGTIKGDGVSKTDRNSSGWEVPTEIKIPEFYNNNRYSSHSFSQDKKFLLMALEREDTFGDLDIYVSFLQSDGSYSEPKNLGSTVNTIGTDGTPFLGSDNKTLYFSSDGHPGYGYNDIFVTTRLDDTWQNWTEPQNLGPEINSRDWDAYFTLPASGDIAYMVTTENSLGNEDIVAVKMPEAAQPDPVVLIKGKVYNQKTGLPLQAKIFYFEAESGAEAGNAISHPTSGDYSIILQYGTKYSFRAEKDDFYAINDFIDLTDVMEYQEIERDLYLVPVEVGQVVRLNNIFFDYDNAELKQDSYDELNRLVKFLKDSPQMEIEIGGHTDYMGTDEYNKDLSLRRVRSVVDYLIAAEISNKRLKAVGYGKSKPIDTNETEEGRAKNRRVEFIILKQ
jgi:outer membrane protein OmpA-like peptidoglycan-associated protein